jgi:hypothetical protein
MGVPIDFSPAREDPAWCFSGVLRCGWVSRRLLLSDEDDALSVSFFGIRIAWAALRCHGKRRVMM